MDLKRQRALLALACSLMWQPNSFTPKDLNCTVWGTTTTTTSAFYTAFSLLWQTDSFTPRISIALYRKALQCSALPSEKQQVAQCNVREQCILVQYCSAVFCNNVMQWCTVIQCSYVQWSNAVDLQWFDAVGKCDRVTNWMQCSSK